LAVVADAATDIKADPTRPTVGITPVPLLIGLGAAIWFVLAMAVLFSSGIAFADYLLAIVVGAAVVFFGLMLILARKVTKDARWPAGRSPLPFTEFMTDNVSIETGTIAAREALVQMIALPIVLAVAATVIGFVFLVSG
jgi:hypothetical protein